MCILPGQGTHAWDLGDWRGGSSMPRLRLMRLRLRLRGWRWALTLRGWRCLLGQHAHGQAVWGICVGQKPRWHQCMEGAFLILESIALHAPAGSLARPPQAAWSPRARSAARLELRRQQPAGCRLVGEWTQGLTRPPPLCLVLRPRRCRSIGGGWGQAGRHGSSSSRFVTGGHSRAGWVRPKPPANKARSEEKAGA